jgi:hypothetical protein
MTSAHAQAIIDDLEPLATPEPHFCKDCLWYKLNNATAYCTAPQTYREKVDLIDGVTKQFQEYPYCSTNRMMSHTRGGGQPICGEEGRWWEPK